MTVNMRGRYNYYVLLGIKTERYMRQRFHVLSILILVSLLLVACGNKKTAGGDTVAKNDSSKGTPVEVSESKADANESSIAPSPEVKESETASPAKPVKKEVRDSETIGSETPVSEAGGSETAPSDPADPSNSDNGDLFASTGDDNKDIAEAAAKKKAGTKGTRDNTPKVLAPGAPGTVVKGNNYVAVDMSNVAEGYIVVTYKGSCGKVKFQVTGPDGIKYTYNVNNAPAVLPLTGGAGNYTIGCFENISGTSYATVYSEVVPCTIANAFGPFLYPNQYVNFNAASAVVPKAQELVASANTDIEAVTLIYNFVIKNVKYDDVKAANVKSGYLPTVDETLATKKGICFDYAALMASMLRSQGIPTKLAIGYADDAYHAWISVYIKDVGWVNNVIYFDGKSWTLVDPTFGANGDASELKKYIGEGGHYNTMYVY